MTEDNLAHEAPALANDAPLTEHVVTIEPNAATPKTAAAPKTRKRSTTSKLAGPQPPRQEAPPSELLGKQTSPAQDDWTTYLRHQAECLLQTKQAEVAQRQAELALRQAEAELLRRLIEAAQRQPIAQPDPAPQLEQAREQITGLQAANAQLQIQLEKAEQDAADAAEASSQLRVENDAMRDELETEKNARLVEQKQFKEQIEREIKYEVEGFKGKLAGKLKPVFDQKSTTDDHPADAELAEFLRGWFSDLEEKLAGAGVQVSKRKL